MKKLRCFIYVMLSLLSFSCYHDSLSEEMEENSFSTLWTIKKADAPHSRAVADTTKRWPSFSNIRIKFLNGTPALQEKVKTNAETWLTYINLTFEYVGADEYADVKIGFDLDTRKLSWSTIGTDCKNIPQDQPSLNFYTQRVSDKKLVSDILRGFGHILGMDLEHKNPYAHPIEFLPSFAEDYNLSEEDVEELSRLYSIDSKNSESFDEYSIMTLEIDESYLTDETYEHATHRNYKLSDVDIEFIKALYPRGKSKIASVEILSESIYTDYPMSFTVDRNGNIYYFKAMDFDSTTYAYNIQLRKRKADGEIVPLCMVGQEAKSISVNSKGNIYIICDNKLIGITPEGNIFSSFPLIQDSLYQDYGLLVVDNNDDLGYTINTPSQYRFVLYYKNTSIESPSLGWFETLQVSNDFLYTTFKDHRYIGRIHAGSKKIDIRTPVFEGNSLEFSIWTNRYSDDLYLVKNATYNQNRVPQKIYTYLFESNKTTPVADLPDYVRIANGNYVKIDEYCDGYIVNDSIIYATAYTEGTTLLQRRLRTRSSASLRSMDIPSAYITKITLSDKPE